MDKRRIFEPKDARCAGDPFLTRGNTTSCERPVAAKTADRNGILETLHAGDAAEVRSSIVENDSVDTEVYAQPSDDINEWSDAWLVDAVRRDPPNDRALNVLADRYWKPLFARCQMLTLNREKASDLAQQAWCRVLRVRHSLKPDGNFPAYLATVATNLWRDAHRADLRAGPMAESHLISLDRSVAIDDGDAVMLGDVIPDLNSLDAEEQTDLAMDLDDALRRLTPLLRDVVVARFIVGESCAEIGRRYNRTEQSVSGWVRQAIREMKLHLQESRCEDACKADL